MPQGPLSAAVAKTVGNSASLLNLDASGNLKVSYLAATGATASALNVAAAAVVKATAGRLAKVVIVAPGTVGSLTLNDCATTGTAATANEIITVGYAALAAGQVISLDWPCATGIVVSAMTTGGQVSVSYT
jgi:hypothetical protein